MKKNGKLLYALLVLSLQAYILFNQGSTFHKIMEIERSLAEQSLSAEDMPRQQVLTISSLVGNITSHVSSYVGGALNFIIVTNFFLVFFLLVYDGGKGEANL